MCGNTNDSLLYAVDLPGAYTRGESIEVAVRKMEQEVRSYLIWKGEAVPDSIRIEIVQDASCELNVRDADSNVIFESEKVPLIQEEYRKLKALARKSASDSQTLYDSISCKDNSADPVRRTFYGFVPRTASMERPCTVWH